MATTSSPRTPISYSVLGSCEATGQSRAAIYRLIKAGELRAVKHGKRTYILERDLRKFMESLSAVEVRAA
jgi:excisionase family DNA binding protein